MRKKEERERAFIDNKIPDIFMHDRSHLYDHDIPLNTPSSFHEYQKMIQEQIFHENKAHDRHFPMLKIEKDFPISHDKDSG